MNYTIDNTLKTINKKPKGRYGYIEDYDLMKAEKFLSKKKAEKGEYDKDVIYGKPSEATEFKNDVGGIENYELTKHENKVNEEKAIKTEEEDIKAVDNRKDRIQKRREYEQGLEYSEDNQRNNNVQPLRFEPNKNNQSPNQSKLRESKGYSKDRNSTRNLSKRRASYMQGTQSSKTKTRQSNTNTVKSNTNSLGFGVGKQSISTLGFNKQKNPYAEMEGEILNFGERLYHKGLKLQEKKEEKIRKIKEEKDEYERKNYSYKPKVNKMSYKAMSKRFNNKTAYNDEDNIIFYRDYLNNKLDELKQKYPKEEQNYSFTPKINKKSISMQKKRRNQTPRYEQLYQNYKTKKFNLENLDKKIYDKDSMFKPQINNYQCAYSDLNFDERKDLFMSKHLEREKSIKEQIQNPLDMSTGQRLFHPEINMTYNRPEGVDVFQSLYYSSLKQRQNKSNEEALIKQQEKANQNKSYTNLESSEMLEERKNRIFGKIFQILDSDKDNLITKININEKGLPDNIKKILSLIITELRQENETLNLNEFVTACQHLFSMLSYTEKREMLEFGVKNNKKNNERNNSFSFKPHINSYHSNSDTIPSYINDSNSHSKTTRNFYN